MTDRIDYLMVIAQEQNLTKAAQRLYISQPALTHYIQKLEQEYEVKLVERRHNTVTLTEAGRQFIKSKQEILILEDTLHRKMRSFTGRETLSIGCGYGRGLGSLTPVLQQLMEKYSELDINIQLAGELSLTERLEKGELDLGIGVMEGLSESMEIEILKKENVGLLIPESWGLVPEDIRPENTLAEPYVLRPEQLSGREFISSDESIGSHLGYSSLLQQYHIRHRRVVTVNSASLIIQLVRSGMGYGFAAVREDGSNLLSEDGKLHVYRCALPGMSLERFSMFAFKRSNPKVDLIRDFITIFRNVTESK